MKIRTLFLRLFQIVGFGLAVIVTLIALTGAWISYTGRQQWAEVRSDLLARGEKLSMTDSIPPEVPDAMNFFADPLWDEIKPGANVPEADRILSVLGAPVDIPLLQSEFPGVEFPDGSSIQLPQFASMLLQSNQQGALPDQARVLLAALRPANATLDRIQDLARRPYAVFPLDYSKGVAMELPFLSPLLQCGRLLSIRAQFRLVIGDADGAFQDTATILSLAGFLENGNSLIQLLTGITLRGLAIDVIREGIPSWDSDTLLALQQKFEGFDSRKAMQRALRGERAGFNDLMSRGDFSIISGGGGVSWQTAAVFQVTRIIVPSNQAVYSQFFQKWIDALEPDAILSPQVKRDMEKSLPNFNNFLTKCRYVFVAMGVPSLEGTFVRTAKTQADTSMAVIACAIQRYRLRNGTLPQDLNALRPEFLSELPRDGVTGESFHYVRESDTTYKLWSIGWNEEDNGGAMPETPRDIKSADWVWLGRVK